MYEAPFPHLLFYYITNYYELCWAHSWAASTWFVVRPAHGQEARLHRPIYVLLLSGTAVDDVGVVSQPTSIKHCAYDYVCFGVVALVLLLWYQA